MAIFKKEEQEKKAAEETSKELEQKTAEVEQLNKKQIDDLFSIDCIEFLVKKKSLKNFR